MVTQRPNRMDIEDFKALLSQEIDIYNRIEHHLERKKDVIIKGDLETLQRIDNELEALTNMSRNMAKKRIDLMVRMGREGQTLREFISSLESGDESRILEQTRQQMIQTTSNIKELSQTNSNLLTQSIRMIEQSVDMIANMLMPKPATYGKNVAANTVDMTPNIDHNYFGTSTISHNA